MRIEFCGRGDRGGASRRKSICAAMALCVSLCAASVQGQEGGNRDYYRANETTDGARILRTVEQYHIGPGIERMNRKDYTAALGDFEFILANFPNHPKGLELLSELCDVRWKVPRCDTEPWFQKAFELRPDEARTFMVFGIHLHRRNNLSAAIESYKKAIALEPALRSAHYNLGLAYFDAKQFDLANRHAQIGYALGMPLPGLRDKLTRAGKWKPLDPEELKSELQPANSPRTAGKPE